MPCTVSLPTRGQIFSRTNRPLACLDHDVTDRFVGSRCDRVLADMLAHDRVRSLRERNWSAPRAQKTEKAGSLAVIT